MTKTGTHHRPAESVRFAIHQAAPPSATHEPLTAGATTWTRRTATIATVRARSSQPVSSRAPTTGSRVGVLTLGGLPGHACDDASYARAA